MNFNFCLNRIIELEEASSTQDIAKELAKSYDEDCVLIQAKTQTNGHGRYDRTWDAGPGGLYISLLLRPTKTVKYTADLSVLAGQAVAETLKELYGVKTKIKLPNDVLALSGGEYKKISGVLIETSTNADNINWLIVGIGVNLNNKPARKINAATVKQITGQNADIAEFRNALVKNFAYKYTQWQMKQ